MILSKRVEFLDSPANAESELRKTIEQSAELIELGRKVGHYWATSRGNGGAKVHQR